MLFGVHWNTGNTAYFSSPFISVVIYKFRNNWIQLLLFICTRIEGEGSGYCQYGSNAGNGQKEYLLLWKSFCWWSDWISIVYNEEL